MKGPNKNTNLYKFSHSIDMLTYAEDRMLSGPWWEDYEEWFFGFKPWFRFNYVEGWN